MLTPASCVSILRKSPYGRRSTTSRRMSTVVSNSSSKFESCGEDSRLRTSELHVSNALKGAVRASELNQSRETALPIEVADAEEILKERDACGVGFIASLKNEMKHDTVSKALVALGCMEHRGACSSDNVSGDGAGVMTRIPWALLQKEFPSLNEKTCGVGMIFIPDDDSVEQQAKAIYEKVADAEGFNVIDGEMCQLT